MENRLKLLVVVHLIIGLAPLALRFVPPHVNYLPLIWIIGSVPASQVLLLGFWLAMGTTSAAWRVIGALAGLIYIVTLQPLVGLLERGIRPGELSRFLDRVFEGCLMYGSIMLLVAGSFLVFRRWFATVQKLSDTDGQPGEGRLQFSILQLLVVTSAAALILGLVRSVRTADSAGPMTISMYVLIVCTLVTNTVCAAWASLSRGRFRDKLLLVFVVAILIGVALALAMNRPRSVGAPPLPWWVGLAGVFLTLALTTNIVASLLVVRSCGYRLVPKPRPLVAVC